MRKSKINQRLDLETSLIILGLIIMILGIPVESLNIASTSMNLPGGAGASIDGIKPVSAMMLVVGFITTSIGVVIKYINRKH